MMTATIDNLATFENRWTMRHDPARVTMDASPMPTLWEVPLAVLDRHLEAVATEDRIVTVFDRFVGAPVARAALAESPTLGTRQVDASVLFIDVVGSCALAESVEIDDLVTMLNGLFAIVVDVTATNGGHVNKFLGDGAMVVYTAAGHQAAALRSARTIAGRLGTLRDSWPMLDAGIGVASGTVAAGHMGASQRLEFTVIGRPVNLASRLSAAAKAHPGRVLAADTTVAHACDEARRWRPSDIVQLKGLSQPSRTFTVHPEW